MQIIYKETNVLSITGNITLAKLSSLRNEGEQIIKDLNQPCNITLSNLHNTHIAIISLLVSWIKCARLHNKTIKFTEIPIKLRTWLQVISFIQLPEFS